MEGVEDKGKRGAFWYVGVISKKESKEIKRTGRKREEGGWAGEEGKQMEEMRRTREGAREESE